MSDYFRHARSVSRALKFTRRMAPAPVGRNLVRTRDGIRFVDAAAARSQPESWLPLFQAAIDRGVPVTDGALGLIHAEVNRYDAGEFYPAPADRAARARVPEAAARVVRAALGDARLRTARPHVPRVRGHFVPGGARLLSQVHGRRAHAADDSEPGAPRRAVPPRPRTLRRAARRPARAGAARPVAAPATTSANGATRSTRSRAYGWPGRCSSVFSCRRPTGSWSSSSSATISACRWRPSGATSTTRKWCGSSRSWSASRNGSRCSA